jgi:hydroxymethylbilane synthase
LGLEIRSGDERTRELLQPLIHEPTFAAVRAERAMLRTLQGGCSAPIAALGTVTDSVLTLHGRILSPNGKERIDAVQSAPLSDNPDELGIRVAEKLKAGN